MWKRPELGTVIPYLIADDPDDLLDFLEDAFEGEVIHRNERPDGTVIHAEVRLGDGMVIVAEPTGESGTMPATIHLYVPDCDDAFAAALDAGAVIVVEPSNHPESAERYGGVVDPAGNLWWIATRLREVDSEAEERLIDELAAASEPSPGPED
ncbi:MAG: VOC family protein [Acidimicrobiia bacterium]|nr:MAG: VOC family protein [Acidimicrobiia bacterium]